MVRLGRRKGSRSGRRWNPNLYILDNVAVITGDGVITTTVYTNSDQVPVSLVLKNADFSVFSGAAAARVWFVVRRVPQGYAPPAVTIATGLTAWADQPDVLAYGTIQVLAASSLQLPSEVRLTKLRAQTVMYQGDILVVQMVTDTNSTGQNVSGEVAFGTRAT